MTRTVNFFPETAIFQRSQTDLFEFVWTTAAALWNLRWQVNGFLAVAPKATKEDLDSRFLRGSDIQSANFRRACQERSWSQQQEQFALHVLVVALAIYEGWAESLANRFPSPGTKRSLPEQLTFPSQGSATAAKYNSPGVGEALVHMAAPKSPTMGSTFTPPLRALSKYSPAGLQDMMLCYRYFKELRNLLVHGVGTVDAWAAKVYADFLKINPANLGMSALPRHHSSRQGDPARLDLHGVVGFAGVLQRIVATIEGTVAETMAGEEAFVDRWRTQSGVSELSSAPAKRAEQIAQIASTIGFPRPRGVTNLEPLLLSRGLVTW